MNEIKPGTAVRIVDAGRYGCGDELNGRTATVVATVVAAAPATGAWWNYGGYGVRLTEDAGDFNAGDEVHAERVEPLAVEQPEPEILLDIPRLQAAQFAKTLLGEYADLDEIIRLAEWVLKVAEAAEEPAEPEPYTPQVGDRVRIDAVYYDHRADRVGQVGTVGRPQIDSPDESVVALVRGDDGSGTYATAVSPAPVEEEPVSLIAQAPVAEPEGVTISDKDGDRVSFEVAEEPGEAVFVALSSPGGAWISGDDLDRVIAFLQQARDFRASLA